MTQKNMFNNIEVIKRFRFDGFTSTQLEQMKATHEKYLTLVEYILQTFPNIRKRSLALTHIEESMLLLDSINPVGAEDEFTLPVQILKGDNPTAFVLYALEWFDDTVDEWRTQFSDRLLEHIVDYIGEEGITSTTGTKWRIARYELKSSEEVSYS